MSGFDPSRYLEPELPMAGGAPAPSAGEAAVAGVADARRLDDGTLIDEETGEILDSWAPVAGAVAGVAGVAATHDLPLTSPFARELNAMFSFPPPTYIDRRRWLQICKDARRFAEEKAADALAAGWEPIELFGYSPEPWKRKAYLGTNGVVALLRGRGVGSVEPHAIEIINRIGAHNRAYRAHSMSAGRDRALLMWDAFHPSNAKPEGKV